MFRRVRPSASPCHFFPGVRDAGVDRRVHDAHGGIFLLRRIDPIEPFGADTDFHRVAAVHDVIDRVGEDVLLGVAREAVDHREVAFLNTFGGDLEMFFRAVGYVVGRVGRRPVVFIRIDAEHREVARVPGPCPVVGVAAELADRRGRSTYQADIVELLVDEQELLVAVVHLLDRGFVAAVLAGFSRISSRLSPAARRSVMSSMRLRNLTLRFSFGKFLFARLCPEAVGQIVVLDGRQALDRSVAAVVVGNQQSFRGDELGRAAVVEEHDGVFERSLVDAVKCLPQSVGILLARISSMRDEIRLGSHMPSSAKTGNANIAAATDKKSFFMYLNY